MDRESELERELRQLQAQVSTLEASQEEQERLRRRLSETEGRLSGLQDAARAGFFTWAPSGRTLAPDAHLRRLLELPVEGDAVDGSLDEWLLGRVPDLNDRRRLQAFFDAVERGDERPIACEFTVRLPSGTERHLEVHASAQDASRAATGPFLCVCLDITDGKRTERELRNSAQRLREAEQLAGLGNWWWDVRSGQVTWSDEIYRIFRLRPGEFTPQIDSILALSPWPEENQRDRELIQRAIDNREGGSYEQRFLRPDGSIGYYHSTFQGIYEADDLVAMRGTVQDITVRKQAELELKRNEENLRVTLDSIGDAVIATDTRGCVTRMNPVAQVLTGWNMEEAMGRALEDVFPIFNALTRAKVENPVDKVLARDGVVGLANHTILIDRAGNEYQIADSGAPIRSTSGETVGVVLVFRDVTEEYALQERVRQSEKMQAIGQLAGGVAHDFNNMLSGIIGSAELLQEYTQDSDDARDLQTILLHSAEQAASLTEKLLAFARRTPPRTEFVDVHSVLADALAILRHTIGQQVIVAADLRAGSSVVEADRAQLESAFLNLGINAAQAMSNRGRIVVTSRETTLDQLACDQSTFELRPGPYIAVEVRDSGHGIRPHHLGRVFEPFFTTKGPGEGTGLGMAAVYGSVRGIHGAVNVESEEGVGTAFTVLLPLVDRAPDRSDDRPEPVPGQGLVLVVDDEPITRATAEAILRRLGYGVLAATDGPEALKVYQDNRDRVDLVLLDMVMPEMGGRECFAALKSIDPSVKVLLCSGFAHEGDVEEMRKGGLLGLLRKPYRSAHLSRAVRDAMRPAMAR